MMHRPAIKAGLELASRAGQNPVAAQAHDLLRTIVRSGYAE